MIASTRRRFLHGLAGAAAAPLLFRAEQSRPRSTGRQVVGYVGTYSQGSATARGKGIHIFEMNAETGALSVRDVFETPSNPSWLALDPTRTHIYAANGLTGGGPGSVSAFGMPCGTRLLVSSSVGSWSTIPSSSANRCSARTATRARAIVAGA